jgi:hypothetical protein
MTQRKPHELLVELLLITNMELVLEISTDKVFNHHYNLQ